AAVPLAAGAAAAAVCRPAGFAAAGAAARPAGAAAPVAAAVCRLAGFAAAGAAARPAGAAAPVAAAACRLAGFAAAGAAARPAGAAAPAAADGAARRQAAAAPPGLPRPFARSRWSQPYPLRPAVAHPRPPARRPSAPGPSRARPVDPPVPPAVPRGLLAPHQPRLAELLGCPPVARVVRGHGDFLPWAPVRLPASARRPSHSWLAPHPLPQAAAQLRQARPAGPDWPPGLPD